ncbi:Alpha/Beta hydrolase fold containing protein [Trema orientale]|uniref:Alpha/Beta hydrolase fold containing protein n=1 Tax=Trema orientale TaxID=63057 RepID=A0A2P5CKQ0_TREOI|nr:Alpha/Beta hydrolase fold containing protein [Trema orientale]
MMELLATCSSSSSSSSSSLFGTNKFRCLFSPSKRRTNHWFVTQFNGRTNLQFGGSRAMASAAWNGYAGSASFRPNNGPKSTSSRSFTQVGSCLVIPPPRGTKPRAIIKFLGGAFLGAVPELTYSYVIELLAKEGFVIISVPYNVTFDHADATKQVYERFNGCLDSILTSGIPHSNLSPAQLSELPLFSVGHSNGALLQVLTGSYFADKIPKANAIISYNNKPATQAVPYFEQLGPLVRQMMPVVEASPVYSMARSASGDAWKVLIDAAGAIIPDNDQETLNSVTKFVDQLPSVFGEVTQGISEFKPTPSENRDRCKNSYNVKHTLLVKFNFDTIDETDLLEETLKPRVELIGGTLEKVELSGNHITPCIQEPKWRVGDVYTPADAIAQGFKTLSLNDSRVLVRTISNWFRRFED